MIWVSFFNLFLYTPSFGHDTDLYMASGEGIEPNILIMFDNSGSMDEPASSYVYDASVPYDPVAVPLEDGGKVYYKSGSNWILFKGTISQVPCSTARNALSTKGFYQGNTSSSCSRNYYTLRTGNYRNFMASIGEGNQNKRKIEIAQDVVKDLLDAVSGVRLGFMVFNYSEGGRIQSTIKSLDDTTRTQLKADVDAIEPSTWTPLAETLYEAGLYFKGGASYFNSGTQYTSPIQYHCQRNYVIVVTDGDSTKDRNAVLGQIIKDRDGDGREPGGANAVTYWVRDSNGNLYDGEGTDYLDDVAKSLYDTDLSSSMEGKQNVITYTIGFAVQSQHQLLERTATQGHGRYFYCDDALGLADSFQNIVDDILAKTSSFVAPIVPVSRMERTTAGDKIYLALFKPSSNKMWSGNIKKFGVAQSDDPSRGIHIGDVTDANNMPALDSNGQFYATTRSFWTSVSMDGGEVEKGGVGEKLLSRSTARNIYTYLGTNVDLTHSSNAFTAANIPPTVLGLGAELFTERDNLIAFVQGQDAYDDNGNGNKTEKRDWVLGSFLHSRPFIIHYSGRSVVFAGANDGMLHAFDDSDGTELWAFIPPNLLSKLQALHADVVESFVDGSPKAYIKSDPSGTITTAILIFGERRGGNHYYALDVTNPLTPRYAWKIGPDLADFSEMGQTWSAPILGRIENGNIEGKWVAFIGGGYDDNQDNDVPGPDSKGRAVYVIDVLDGTLIWRYSNAENGQMNYSIPSDIARVDLDGDGMVDRVYVGDMGGQVWRFDINGVDASQWTGKIVFKSNAGADGSTGRKIFYPPDVTLENDDGEYELVLFGTGDREHPKDTTVLNRLYAIKDKNERVYAETDLVDVTSDLLQTGTEEEKNLIRTELRAKNGWYIKLDSDSGEKCLAPPVVFYRVVYFTTFSPTFGVETDPCFVGEGTARAYSLNYKTANAVFNLDATNDVSGTQVLARTDRSKVMGTAIPSGVIITFVAGKAVSYIGVGGGVYSPGLTSTKSLVHVNWKLVK